MKNNRKQYSADFKAKVALAALNGHHIISELAAMYEVSPVQISKWKAQLTRGQMTFLPTNAKRKMK